MTLPEVRIVNVYGPQLKLVPEPDFAKDLKKKKVACGELLTDLLDPMITELWKSIKCKEFSAEQINISLFYSGRKFMYGPGNKNPVAAAARFYAAAKLPEAMFELARCCENGVGVKKNLIAARFAYNIVENGCLEILYGQKTRSAVEQVWAHFLLGLTFHHNHVNPPFALEEFQEAKRLIDKDNIDDPKLAEAVKS
jgi:hypothetical protein